MDTLQRVNSPVSSESQARSAEQTQPIPNRPIQWASADPIETELEILKNRNWISEDLLVTSQQHWHCSRSEAAERLLTALDESSE